MKFQGVIFDLDGTLLDTIEDITWTLNLVMARHGFRQYSKEECKKMVGDGMEELLKRAVPEIAGDEEAIKNLIQEYRQEYARTWKEHSRPYPGIPETLKSLKEADLKLAVLSNKSHEFTELMTKELLPFEFEVISGARPGQPVKPDPEPAFQVLRALELRPQEAIYVGDTSVDMKTAKAAGMFAAGALWGFRKAEELLRSGANILLKKPSDLLEVISGNGKING
ncbi:MAG: HAD-IA family hydrolase [Candidatus Saccharicenans sp.]|nr:HAD-IA family hydrolase [Candidatus Saccharicenans sp.]